MKSFARPAAICTVVALSLGGVVFTASAASAAEPAADVATIDALFDAGKDVTLTADITETQSHLHLPEGSSSTLDLNGHSLTLTGAGEMPAILVQAGSHLTITDSSEGGILTATGGSQSAGIGSEKGTDTPVGDPGLVEITGGTVVASGSNQLGAGIGGSGWSKGPAVSISGGDVIARGSDGAPGIGAGYNRTANAISISGGTVTAYAGGDATAIGAPIQGGQSSTTISGGFVTVVGSNQSVLGTASTNGYPQYSFGEVAITGGTVVIPEDSFLDIPTTKTVSSSGIVEIEGLIRGEGTFVNNGSVLGDGEITSALTGRNYSVSYDARGGDLDEASVSLRAGSFSAAGRLLPAPTHSTLPFTGWNTQANGTGATVTTTTDISSIFPAATAGASDVTLYAMYGGAPVFESTSLAGAIRGQDYSQTLSATGESSVDFSVIDGGLPAGLELNTVSGVISGTPSTPGIFSISVLAHNEGGADVRRFTIYVEREAKTLAIATITAPTAVGTKATLPVAGLDAGENYSVIFGGKTVASGVANAQGKATPSFTVPTVAPGKRLTQVIGSATTRTGASTVNVVAATKKFSVSTNKKTYHYGQNATITVTGLAAGEKVTITFRGKIITSSKAVASAKGTYTIKASVGSSKGTKTVKVTGIKSTRAGSTSLKVTK